MAWIYLALATFGEIAWVVTLKLSEGYTRPLWIGANLFFTAWNVFTLARAFGGIPMTIAYSIWIAVSAVGVAVCSQQLFEEQIGGTQWMFVALILIGVIGLKVSAA
jgi:quaternary ammonium compound-resistance protein SugE